MKKLLLVLLAVVMGIMLVACGVNEDIDQGEQNLGQENQENQNPAEEGQEGEEPGEEGFEFVDPETAPSAEMQTLVDELNTSANVQIRAPFTMKITNESAQTDVGIKAEDFDTLIEDGIKSESMMSPSDHSFCIVKVKEGQDVATVKQTIFDNCDPNKWICMSAQKVLVVESGNYVMLVMSTPEICDSLYTAFEAKFGADTLGTKLERAVEI